MEGTTAYTAELIMQEKHFYNESYLAETETNISAIKVGIFDHKHPTVKPVNRKYSAG